jgi:epoxyqueuosine reductase
VQGLTVSLTYVAVQRDLPMHDTTALKIRAEELGFFLCRVAEATYLDDEARRLEDWLNRGYHGKMNYMANYFDLRVDPRKLVPGARSVICMAFNYHNPDLPKDEDVPRLSQYAYGEDYHKVLRKRLKQLLQWIRDTYGEVAGRVFVDSAPVMERDWAAKAGIGWMGKHTLVIHPRAGSYFFLAEIILDLAFEPDPPLKDYCGTCRRCIEACPTEAIAPQGYLLDASRCIAYLTIELREAIPAGFADKMENWMFGCDICQDVCPWNRFASRHGEPAFEPPEGLLEMSRRDWLELSEEAFDDLFSRSAVRRAGFSGLQRNIRFLEEGRSEGAT